MEGELRPKKCFMLFMQVFDTRDKLLKWVREVAFELGFVVVILRSYTEKQPGRKTFVVLGYERGSKYRQCDCPLKLKGRPLKTGE